MCILQSLYEDGIRNMAIAGIPLICGPPGLGAPVPCVNDQTSDSNVYNRKLQAMLTQLQPSLPGSKLVYADICKPLIELATNPSAHGTFFIISAYDLILHLSSYSILL